MELNTIEFDESKSLERLKHFLPGQASLKDFVHHNTLHAFQHDRFYAGLQQASQIFGYTTYLSLDEYRSYYASRKIIPEVLDRVILAYCKKSNPNATAQDPLFHNWKERVLNQEYDIEVRGVIGKGRKIWKDSYGLNMNKVVHPTLFRLLSGFLDQGISLWTFPNNGLPFLEGIKSLEENGLVSFFKSKRSRQLLMETDISIEKLLSLLIANKEWYDDYIFEQQFAHPGWSGFVAVVEKQPSTLLSPRQVSLKELIILELLLEIDAMDHKFGPDWKPWSEMVSTPPEPLFQKTTYSEVHEVLQLWQEAFEWSYFDGVLKGMQGVNPPVTQQKKVSFQGLFCIDDREYSFRRHLENVATDCDTYGTPGYFGVEFYFQPEDGKFHTKACPAPVDPGFLIKEKGRKNGFKKDIHYTKHSHSLFRGWLISNTFGFWSALRLFVNIFKPGISPATAYSFSHMDKHAQLGIEYQGKEEAGLKVGFEVAEMVTRVRNVLKSIGLTENFAPIVYIVGHGGSSVNNPYYAGYDCGACAGRPGAVNARVFSYMANKPEVREKLKEEGITIPESTIFIGAMHDTTRDEIEFYEEDISDSPQALLHEENKPLFHKALSLNAKERSFRFDTVNSQWDQEKIHQEVKKRSVSLFEPRPEWNHTANALCIVGRKGLYKHLYLDKRPFINSYDCSQDPDGKYLMNILSAAVPVCGGINLEYYFSRVDQQKLGAGTKLPHNVVGLFAVANGIDGDLRPGLPSQMVEIHDPVRILFIIEHDPDVVLRVIQSNPSVYEWIANEWVLLTVKNPENGMIYRFREGIFEPYVSLGGELKKVKNEIEIQSAFYKNDPVLITN
ncbi:YbcC family protein [Cyclobacterium jeungdonense]|uniref:Probable inorganic carbon transporter subunit DabA n=1 Tax=Cyclobacterium jeungdonense TaxID=708087 RepID=A0ABT8C499_9BACT|nr:DUF2309 domain-containing protein [Cyclobacterium jeungdonense]MDN3687574.1 DUF2309 domain-containing protein [Cyclobacterium jeungdonense]